jgi:GNAT superfamily N-acetyltransferase
VSNPTILVTDSPSSADRDAITQALVAFNDKMAGPSGFRPLAILIQDDVGKTVGGLWGKTAYDWLVVELFVVPEQFRGQNFGSDILSRAEQIARERGCIGVWLDTYEFQALGFYRKLGYELFGTVDDHPRGSRRFFVKKLL